MDEPLTVATITATVAAPPARLSSISTFKTEEKDGSHWKDVGKFQQWLQGWLQSQPLSEVFPALPLLLKGQTPRALHSERLSLSKVTGAALEAFLKGRPTSSNYVNVITSPQFLGGAAFSGLAPKQGESQDRSSLPRPPLSCYWLQRGKCRDTHLCLYVIFFLIEASDVGLGCD